MINHLHLSPYSATYQLLPDDFAEIKERDGSVAIGGGKYAGFIGMDLDF